MKVYAVKKRGGAGGVDLEALIYDGFGPFDASKYAAQNFRVTDVPALMVSVLGASVGGSSQSGGVAVPPPDGGGGGGFSFASFVPNTYQKFGRGGYYETVQGRLYEWLYQPDQTTDNPTPEQIRQAAADGQAVYLLSNLNTITALTVGAPVANNDDNLPFTLEAGGLIADGLLFRLPEGEFPMWLSVGAYPDVQSDLVGTYPLTAQPYVADSYVYSYRAAPIPEGIVYALDANGADHPLTRTTYRQYNFDYAYGVDPATGEFEMSTENATVMQSVSVYTFSRTGTGGGGELPPEPSATEYTTAVASGQFALAGATPGSVGIYGWNIPAEWPDLRPGVGFRFTESGQVQTGTEQPGAFTDTPTYQFKQTGTRSIQFSTNDKTSITQIVGVYPAPSGGS